MNILDAQKEIVEVAQAILREEVQLIDGCRKICVLRHSMAEQDDEIFIPFRAVESETDHFPLGEPRQYFAPDYLARLDMEMAHYTAKMQEHIWDACRDIICSFS